MKNPLIEKQIIQKYNLKWSISNKIYYSVLKLYYILVYNNIIN